MAEQVPWDELLDGQIYALDPYEEFNLSTPRMIDLLREKARNKGMRVRHGLTRAEHVESGEVEKAGLLVITPARKKIN